MTDEVSTGTVRLFLTNPDKVAVHLEFTTPINVMLTQTDVVLAEAKAKGYTPHFGWGYSGGSGKEESSGEEPSGDKPKCKKCGAAMKYREGTSKNGNFYRVWNCTRNRNHPPKWVNDNDDDDYTDDEDDSY